MSANASVKHFHNNHSNNPSKHLKHSFIHIKFRHLVFHSIRFLFSLCCVVVMTPDAIDVVGWLCLDTSVESCIFSSSCSFECYRLMARHTNACSSFKNYKPISMMTAAFYEYFENRFCQHIYHFNATFLCCCFRSDQTAKSRNVVASRWLRRNS